MATPPIPPIPVAAHQAPTIPLILPEGYGFSAISPAELREQGTFFNQLHVWEPPRRRGSRAYVIGVDVSDGLGLDRSAIEVIRTGTLDDPAEQVAEYVTDRTSPMDLAPIIFAIGMWYRDADGVEAVVAVECNNHGLSTQDTLQLHLGYTHFYRWEYYDAADPAGRFSTKIGWVTTPRTRPLLLDKFHTALTTLDPVTHLPDLITHSPLLHDELKDFQTQGALWEAAAARGAHDDCVMATAIGNYVAWRLQAGETEPLDARRRRRSEQLQIQAAAAETIRPDYRNTPMGTDEVDAWGAGTLAPEEQADRDAAVYTLVDPRAVDWG